MFKRKNVFKYTLYSKTHPYTLSYQKPYKLSETSISAFHGPSRQLIDIHSMHFWTENDIKIPDSERILKSSNPYIARLDAYLRLIRFDKQIGTFLLLLPSFWGISVSSAPGLQTLYISTLFSVGALAARSAGCVINDYWDIDIDKHVERTKFRPLTSGEISKSQALTLFTTLTAGWFGIAYLLDPLVIKLGFLSVPLVIAYPRFKRFFKYPQLMLGVTFNWGIFMGYAAMASKIDYQICLPLYMGAILWTVVYDTIYAFQDIDHDKQIGVYSWAIEFEKQPKSILGALAVISTSLITATGYIANLHWSFYPI